MPSRLYGRSPNLVDFSTGSEQDLSNAGASSGLLVQWGIVKMRAAEQLVGLTLNGNWKVMEKPSRSKTATGANFSVGYVVKNLDEHMQVFLKAMDYAAAFQQPLRPGQSLADVLKAMTDPFIFERDMCGGAGLDP